MLLQTNSYVVPKDKRAEHSRLIRRFKQTLHRLGCDQFDVFEQVGANWSNGESTGRFVQIMQFRDRKHQLSVQAAERSDPTAQALIAEFCELINFPYQQQQGLFAVGFYSNIIPAGRRPMPQEQVQEQPQEEVEPQQQEYEQVETETESTEEQPTEQPVENEEQTEYEPSAEGNGDEEFVQEQDQEQEQELEQELENGEGLEDQLDDPLDENIEETDEPEPPPPPQHHRRK
jgi:hypothetical protein